MGEYLQFCGSARTLIISRNCWSARVWRQCQWPCLFDAVHLSLVSSAMLLCISWQVGAIVLGYSCTDSSIILYIGFWSYSYSIYVIHDLLVSKFWNIIQVILRIFNNVIDVIDWLSIIGYRWSLCATVWLHSSARFCCWKAMGPFRGNFWRRIRIRNQNQPITSGFWDIWGYVLEK